MTDNVTRIIAELEQQLAASQAREKVLRDALFELANLHVVVYSQSPEGRAYMKKLGDLMVVSDDTALKAALKAERERCAKVCDAEQAHWEKMRTGANKSASEHVLYGYSGRDESAGACAMYIRALGDEERALAQTDDYSVLKAAEYLRQLSPHVATREGAVLLADAKAEIVALRAGVNECYRMLISEPNTKLALDRAETMLRELMKPNA